MVKKGIDQFELEAKTSGGAVFELGVKTSGGAVFELGVKTSKENKAIRRIAEPLMAKHWKDSVTNLHRIYRVAEYLLRRSRRRT